MTRSAASFRDPAGRCCRVNERILRLLAPGTVAGCEAFLQSPTALQFTAQRQLIGTRRLTAVELANLHRQPEMESLLVTGAPEAVFEHECIFFPSYPYEWPSEMLWEAGHLTLELALAALADGYGLKDATPYNVLYRGGEPVFVDLLSFEPRVKGDPVWQPYAQFVRTFLLPLLVHRQWGIKLADIFTTRRDGLEPQEVYPLCGPLQRFCPPNFSLVSMPTWLRPKARALGAELYHERLQADPEKARFIVESLLKQLRRSLNSLKPRPRPDSAWSSYMETHSYSEQAFNAKQQFVQELLREFKPVRVLDLGANTGHFSALAATAGAEVVAIDCDPECVGALWRRVRQERLNILPLVIDLSRPSPALGWRNRECPAFLERAGGAFDGVLMLAVLHHLLVTERVPLEEILDLAAELTTSLLIIEFVAPEDEMFRQLVRGRENLHAGLNEASFVQACAAHFEIIRSQLLPGTCRRLYGLKRKGAAA